MHTVEFILLLSKGTKPINNCSSKNLLQYNGVRGYKRHPEEKSRYLIKEFIKNSTDAGDVVLDMFMGSGSTGEASIECGRSFIGIDIDKQYFDVAMDSLKRYERIYKGCYTTPVFTYFR